MMHALPHTYEATALETHGYINTTSPGLPPLSVAAPAEFDGPGDAWSPETLLTAAIADCYILTFKAVANASKLEWSDISCRVEGVLDKVDRGFAFTTAAIHARLEIPEEADRAAAERVLVKTEANCLISRSLKTAVSVIPEIVISPATATLV